MILKESGGQRLCIASLTYSVLLAPSGICVAPGGSEGERRDPHRSQPFLSPSYAANISRDHI